MTSFLKCRLFHKNNDIKKLNKIISELEDFISNTELQYNSVFIHYINRLFDDIRISYGTEFYKKLSKHIILIYDIIQNPSIDTENKVIQILDYIDYLNVLRAVYVSEFKKV